MGVFFCSPQPEHRLNGYDEFDVADRLRQRGWVRPPRLLSTSCLPPDRSTMPVRAAASLLLTTPESCSTYVCLILNPQVVPAYTMAPKAEVSPETHRT